jgi:hypothetical protein
MKLGGIPCRLSVNFREDFRKLKMRAAQKSQSRINIAAA